MWINSKKKKSPPDGCIHIKPSGSDFFFNRFTCAPWLSTLRQDSFVCVTWRIHMCDMTRSHVRHDPFICVTWLIHVCVVTHSYDLFCYWDPIFFLNECVLFFFETVIWKSVCYSRMCIWMSNTHSVSVSHSYTHSRMWVFLIHIHIRECECYSFIYTFAYMNERVCVIYRTYESVHTLIKL